MIRKIFITLIFTQMVFSQKDFKKYLNSIKAENLKEKLTIIASDEMQGRDTGSEGQKKSWEIHYFSIRTQQNSFSETRNKFLPTRSC